jgi:hypothetical protein
MDASGVVKWGIMPTSDQSATCKLLRAKKSSGQRPGQQSSQLRNGNPNSQGNKGQQNFVRGGVNHVAIDTAQEAPDVVLGTFLVKSEPISILFDSRASHLFTTDQTTWEREEELTAEIPQLFSIFPNLEDKILFKEGRFVTPSFEGKNSLSFSLQPGPTAPPGPIHLLLSLSPALSLTHQ